MKKFKDYKKEAAPANNKSGEAKPKSKVQTIETKENTKAKNKKFSFLYFKIVSLLDLSNS